MFFQEFHKSLDTLHFGMQKPRAYYIPFADRESALNGIRENSELFTLLSGTWKFKFFKSINFFCNMNMVAICNVVFIGNTLNLTKTLL